MDSEEGIHWESVLIKLAIIGLLSVILLPFWWNHVLDEDGFTKFLIRGVANNVTDAKDSSTKWLVEHTPKKE